MDIDETRDIGKIWGALREYKAWAEGKAREFEVVLLGPDHDNGLRGDLRALHADHAETKAKLDLLEKDVMDTRAWGQRLWDVERHRPGGCLGKEALEALRAELAAEKAAEIELIREERAESMKERIESRRTRLTMIGSIAVALIASVGSVVVAVIYAGGKP